MTVLSFHICRRVCQITSHQRKVMRKVMGGTRQWCSPRSRSVCMLKNCPQAGCKGSRRFWTMTPSGWNLLRCQMVRWVALDPFLSFYRQPTLDFFLFHLLLFVLLSQICLSGLHMLLYLTVLPSLFFLLLLILQPATHFLIKTLTFSSTFNSCPLSLRICRVFAPEISNQRIIMYVHDACFAASIAHASMSAVSHAN